MDANTINATCNVLLVVIGIIGLLLVRRNDDGEPRFGKEEAGTPWKVARL